ncbi:hypothetical protein CEXT_201751 [Caerostris extrusa]|uniref:Uncharacterized protein n=1 Tax=Caerostris extrusa TaxID=172846 RepID=A0AAV4QXJ0_CAEEX|nr:hypothetical protein CEXT_201751 [Caerostris extrusa]
MDCNKDLQIGPRQWDRQNGLHQQQGFAIDRIGNGIGKWIASAKGMVNGLHQPKDLQLDSHRQWIGNFIVWDYSNVDLLLTKALLSSEGPRIKTNKNTVALQPVLSSTTDGKYLFSNAILRINGFFLPSIITPGAAIAVTLMADLSIDQGSIVNTVMQKGDSSSNLLQ